MENLCPQIVGLGSPACVFPQEQEMPDRVFNKLDGRSLWRLAEKEQHLRDQVAVIGRAREALGPWVAQLRHWDVYATFTYDPAKVTWAPVYSAPDIPPPSPSASTRHLRSYLEDLTDTLGRELGAFCALETTKRGWPHWHGLIAAGGLSEDDFKAAWSLWFNQRGYVKMTRVDHGDQLRISQYCSKYLCKETGDVVLWGRLSDKALPGQMHLPEVSSNQNLGT
jgi:hypothetical protein